MRAEDAFRPPAAELDGAVPPDFAVRYTLTLRDVFAQRVSVLIKSWGLQVIVLASATLEGVVSARTAGVWTGIAHGLALYATVLLFLLLLILFTAWRLTAKSNPFATEHLMTLHQDALVEETWHSVCRYRWVAVSRIAVHFGTLCVYFGPLASYTIPRRAFVSPAHERAFVAFVQARLREHGGRAAAARER